MMNLNFSFHLVSFSPWPLLMSFSLMYMMLGTLNLFLNLDMSFIYWVNLFMILVIYQWWRDVIRESTLQGFHTLDVFKGLCLGMILFILSELMFFVSFFWTYFHLYLSPSVMLGGNMPLYGILSFNPYNIPLLNTLILLLSGVSITLCHHSMMNNMKLITLISIILTIFLGMIFSMFQYLEYYESYFSMYDSMYGSIFYLSTGFHGLHVLIGTIFILINFFRLLFNHYSNYHHFGFEAASWYWHFVDVVWLFLYIFIYWLSY